MGTLTSVTLESNGEDVDLGFTLSGQWLAALIVAAILTVVLTGIGMFIWNNAGKFLKIKSMDVKIAFFRNLVIVVPTVLFFMVLQDDWPFELILRLATWVQGLI